MTPRVQQILVLWLFIQVRDTLETVCTDKANSDGFSPVLSMCTANSSGNVDRLVIDTWNSLSHGVDTCTCKLKVISKSSVTSTKINFGHYPGTPTVALGCSALVTFTATSSSTTTSLQCQSVTATLDVQHNDEITVTWKRQTSDRTDGYCLLAQFDSEDFESNIVCEPSSVSSRTEPSSSSLTGVTTTSVKTATVTSTTTKSVVMTSEQTSTIVSTGIESTTPLTNEETPQTTDIESTTPPTNEETTPTTEKSKADKSTSSDEIIISASIGAGVVVILIVIVAVAVVCAKRRKRGGVPKDKTTAADRNSSAVNNAGFQMEDDLQPYASSSIGFSQTNNNRQPDKNDKPSPSSKISNVNHVTTESGDVYAQVQKRPAADTKQEAVYAAVNKPNKTPSVSNTEEVPKPNRYTNQDGLVYAVVDVPIDGSTNQQRSSLSTGANKSKPELSPDSVIYSDISTEL